MEVNIILLFVQSVQNCHILLSFICAVWVAEDLRLTGTLHSPQYMAILGWSATPHSEKNIKRVKQKCSSVLEDPPLQKNNKKQQQKNRKL